MTAAQAPADVRVPAPTDPVEARRLQALEQLHLLGTGQEERFDRITRLAQRVFDVPIATITLVDEDSLWFKSAQGMPVDRAERQASFCDRTIALGTTHVVPDALADVRYATTPAVTGPPRIRFYAGQPLAGPGGLTVGTLCLFDVRPRSLDAGDVALLEELGRWTEQELAHSVEMDRAREVQQALLPQRPPELPGYRVAGSCQPAFAVGGDLFDHDLVGGDLVLSVADVMGKGAGAAILMATVRAVLRTTVRDSGARDGRRPEGDVLTATNRILLPDLQRTGSFVTAFHARLDAATGRVRYGDAGHGLSLVRRGTGGVERLAGEDLPLGIDVDQSWTEHEVVLEPGDTLFSFSDGLFDVLGGTHEALAEVTRLLEAHPEPDDLLRAVRALASAAAPLDDVTAVAVRRVPRT
ncbi:PP2C family protein-serine/threonine phosphatase [Geodermatophilus sp. URMC 61]|uniref:PP2C family protein-serine/threonine phosphatase n=1 Tax=Geodermatophilus sp. URMC 61 TaxID=3423411 RepID=UPI00406C0933